MIRENRKVDQGTVLSITIPTVAVLVGILVNGRQIEALRNEMNARFEAVNARFEAVNVQFEAAHQALLRVEGVLDARLKHLEEERRR